MFFKRFNTNMFLILSLFFASTSFSLERKNKSLPFKERPSELFSKPKKTQRFETKIRLKRLNKMLSTKGLGSKAAKHWFNELNKKDRFPPDRVTKK